MMTRPQQSAAAAEELAELGNGNEDIAPVPQIALQAFCETAEIAAAVQAAARDRRMSGARARIRMGGIASAIEAYRNSPTPDVLLLETGMRGGDFLTRLDELAQVCDVATRVVLIGHHNDIAIHCETMRRGVNDHVFAPLSPLDIVRAVSRLFGGPGSERLALGRVIAVIGAKGGVGASTVAHNIAWTAARDLAIETVIADLDLAFGTASLGYNQEPPWDIADAVSSPDRVDAALIDRLMTQCADRLRLLAAPAAVERIYDLAAESFEPVIGALRASAPCVVLDLPHAWTAWIKRILIEADDVLVVAAPDLADLRNAKNLIDTLRAARPDNRRPRYCLNQVGVPNRPEIKSSDFARALEDEPVAVIPFEPQLFGAAANSGQMIAKIDAGDPVVGLFRQLAQTLAGDVVGEREQATPLSPPSGKLVFR
jgi:pilus assembly protein CpaE